MIDFALAGSALMMGLAGGPHCATMCGAAYGGLVAPAPPGQRVAATLALHGGRLFSYAAAGALVAASVAGLSTLQSAAPVMRPLWTLVHVAAIALGLWLAWQARAPAWLSGRLRQVVASDTRPVQWLRRMPVSARAGVAGACWAAVPCGLLQSALLVAALASGPLAGAGVMAGFALASALSLWLAPWLWSRLRWGDGARRAALPIRLAGIVLAASSVFALSHGLGAAIENAICRIV